MPASLADLHGPASVLELPARLYWSGPGPGGRFDLADLDQAAVAYEAVLEAARSLDDITAHLDAGLVAALWPSLGMRAATRRAWEAAFPELAEQDAATEPCGATHGLSAGHLYGRCNLAAGHQTSGWHREMRGGKIWAEWRGPMPDEACDICGVDGRHH